MKKYRILYDDVSKRFRKGEVGIAVNNTFPEKYAVCLHLGTLTYFSERDDEVHVFDRTFFFYKEEVEEIGESSIEVGKSFAEVLDESLTLFGEGAKVHLIEKKLVVPSDTVKLTEAKQRKLEKLGWKQVGTSWTYGE